MKRSKSILLVVLLLQFCEVGSGQEPSLKEHLRKALLERWNRYENLGGNEDRLRQFRQLCEGMETIPELSLVALASRYVAPSAWEADSPTESWKDLAGSLDRLLQDDDPQSFQMALNYLEHQRIELLSFPELIGKAAFEAGVPDDEVSALFERMNFWQKRHHQTRTEFADAEVLWSVYQAAPERIIEVAFRSRPNERLALGEREVDWILDALVARELSWAPILHHADVELEEKGTVFHVPWIVRLLARAAGSENSLAFTETEVLYQSVVRSGTFSRESKEQLFARIWENFTLEKGGHQKMFLVSIGILVPEARKAMEHSLATFLKQSPNDQRNQEFEALALVMADANITSDFLSSQLATALVDRAAREQLDESFHALFSVFSDKLEIAPNWFNLFIQKGYFKAAEKVLVSAPTKSFPLRLRTKEDAEDLLTEGIPSFLAHATVEEQYIALGQFLLIFSLGDFWSRLDEEFATLKEQHLSLAIETLGAVEDIDEAVLEQCLRVIDDRKFHVQRVEPLYTKWRSRQNLEKILFRIKREEDALSSEKMDVWSQYFKHFPTNVDVERLNVEIGSLLRAEKDRDHARRIKTLCELLGVSKYQAVPALTSWVLVKCSLLGEPERGLTWMQEHLTLDVSAQDQKGSLYHNAIEEALESFATTRDSGLSLVRFLASLTTLDEYRTQIWLGGVASTNLSRIRRALSHRNNDYHLDEVASVWADVLEEFPSGRWLAHLLIPKMLHFMNDQGQMDDSSTRELAQIDLPKELRVILNDIHDKRIDFADLEPDFENIPFGVQQFFSLHLLNGFTFRNLENSSLESRYQIGVWIGEKLMERVENVERLEKERSIPIHQYYEALKLLSNEEPPTDQMVRRVEALLFQMQEIRLAAEKEDLSHTLEWHRDNLAAWQVRISLNLPKIPDDLQRAEIVQGRKHVSLTRQFSILILAGRNDLATQLLMERSDEFDFSKLTGGNHFTDKQWRQIEAFVEDLPLHTEQRLFAEVYFRRDADSFSRLATRFNDTRFLHRNLEEAIFRNLCRDARAGMFLSAKLERWAASRDFANELEESRKARHPTEMVDRLEPWVRWSTYQLTEGHSELWEKLLAHAVKERWGSTLEGKVRYSGYVAAREILRANPPDGSSALEFAEKMGFGSSTISPSLRSRWFRNSDRHFIEESLRVVVQGEYFLRQLAMQWPDFEEEWPSLPNRLTWNDEEKTALKTAAGFRTMVTAFNPEWPLEKKLDLLVYLYRSEFLQSAPEVAWTFPILNALRADHFEPETALELGKRLERDSPREGLLFVELAEVAEMLGDRATRSHYLELLKPYAAVDTRLKRYLESQK